MNTYIYAANTDKLRTCVTGTLRAPGTNRLAGTSSGTSTGRKLGRKFTRRPVIAAALFLSALFVASVWIGPLGFTAPYHPSSLGALAGPPTYAVTFNETGLAPGTLWSVVFNGSTSSSTTSNINFTAPNGVYNFSVPHLVGRYPSPADGAITVSGGPYVQPINFSASPEYNVTINETGLPNGTEWIAVLAGTHHISYTNTIVVPQGTGTYNWSVLSVPAPARDGTAGWAAVPFSGIIKVSAAAGFINVTYVRGWNVVVTESGLPSGTTWHLDLNQTSRSSYTSQMTFLLANGTYSFVVPSPLAGPTDTRYIPNALSLPVTVAGANTSAGVTYSTQYYLATIASPLSGGTVLPASQWYNATASVPLSASPASEYVFGGWSGLGNGSYTGSNPTPSITMNGPIEETAVFYGFFRVAFTESGLPAGTQWSVTFNGALQSSTTTSIDFNELDGTYNYSIAPVTGFTTPVYSGKVTVNGADVNVPVPWSQVTYRLNFTESGLPAGTKWSVTVAGTEMNATGTTITFNEPNGSWPYQVGNAAGYTPAPKSGTAVIVGAELNVSIAFTQVLYAVDFTAKGLPAGTPWAVTLNGRTNSSSASTLSFQEPNGSFAFSVGALPGRVASPSSGTVHVAGAPVAQSITWTGPYYAVIFTESGLPSGTNWSVSLNGTLNRSTSTTIGFSEPNGSYGFALGPLGGYISSPSSGTVVVTGSAVSQSIAFRPFTYSVTFQESGLSSGTNWSVTVNGVVLSSTSNSIVAQEPNGTVNYRVGNVSGYSSNIGSGSLLVDGGPKLVTLTFSSTSSNAGPNLLLYGGIAAAVLVVAAVLALLLVRRRRRPEPPKKT
jgi:hypothetical protein